MDDYYLSLFGATIRVIPPSFGDNMFLVLAGILFLASGFVSASEVSFFSLKPKDHNEIEDELHHNDSSIQRLLSRSKHLLATILILNNLINVSIIILCNHFFTAVFDFSSAPWLGFVMQTGLLTFLLLLFGEIMPKIYASQHSLHFSRIASPILSFFDRLFNPLSSLLVRSSGIFNRVGSEKGESISLDVLSQALELTSNESDDDKQMLEGIIRFGDKSAKEIMTARLDISALNINLTFKEVIAYVVECGYSRIPVYVHSQDTIKGILYVKDLLPHINKPDGFKWQTLIRAPYFVPETKKVDSLLEDFQTNKIHMAIVVDEYGGTSGVVTMEDILEEIVGDINDEYDEEETIFTKQKDGSYLFDAKTSIEEFCRILDLDYETFEEVSGDADTLAGMILELKGEFPLQNEVVVWDDHSFEVIELDKRRIKKLKYKPFDPQDVRTD